MTNIYFIFNSDTNSIKIGKSANVSNRIKQLQTACNTELILIGLLSHTDKSMEKALHRHFKSYNLLGEHFEYEGKLKEFCELLFMKVKEFDCEKNNLALHLINNNFQFYV